MAQPDLPSVHDSSQENKKEKEAAQPKATRRQRSKACFLKGVSYFAGDMEPLAKWMESKSTQIFCYTGQKSIFTNKKAERHT